VDPARVAHALDADHPIVGELVVAADLTAADEAGAVPWFGAEPCRRRKPTQSSQLLRHSKSNSPSLIHQSPNESKIIWEKFGK
jgi:hypothetical protein